MNTGLILVSALWMVAQPQQSGPPMHYGPMRNTFIIASETVIDTANSVNVDADDTTFTAQMQSLKAAKDNLTQLAADDREHEIAIDATDMIFIIASCHIQSIDGTKTDACKAQIGKSLNHMMVMLNKHKSGGAWVDGAPAA